MNTNNIKTKTISIGKFKIYSDDGILKVKDGGQVFNLLSDKKTVTIGRFFSIKDSEVLKLIRKILKRMTNGLKRNSDNDSIRRG